MTPPAEKAPSTTGVFTCVIAPKDLTNQQAAVPEAPAAEVKSRLRLHLVVLVAVAWALTRPAASFAAEEKVAVLKLSQWCTATVPAGEWEVGKTVSITLQYKGLPKTRLCCHLHGWRADRSMMPGALAIDMKPPQ